jgi:hypothetical protein
VRKNVRTMPQSELKRYTDAVNALRNKVGTGGASVFENFAAVHSSNIAQAHYGAYFLPWHRQMLHEFEVELNKVASPGSPLGVPYWDFTAYNNQFTVDPMWQRMGGAVANQPLPSAPFRAWSSGPNAGRAVTRGFTVGSARSDAFVSSGNIASLVSGTSQSYATFNNYLEAAHNSPHASIDGDMGRTGLAANDPLFYSHHAYIDMIWRRWQDAGAGNKFGGTGSDGAGATLNQVMNPYGRSVRSILEGISRCVRYESAGGSVRQASSGPVHMPPAVQEATVRAEPIKFESIEEKRAAQLELANVKADDPARAINQTLEAASARETTIAAMRKFGFSEAAIATFVASFKTLELMNSVDVRNSTVAKIEAGAPPSAIKSDGKNSIAAIESGQAPPGTDDSDVAGHRKL